MTPAEDPTAQPAHPAHGQPPERQPAPAAPAQQRREALRSDQAEPTPNILPAVRASDSDRNAVAERLRDAFADGRLDEEEFDVRMQRALTARTRQDLEGLLGDLGIPAAAQVPSAGSPAAQPYPVDPSATTGRQYSMSVAIMGGVERRGRWRVPAETTAIAFMGGVELDLRAATLTSQVTTIRAVAVMGGVEVTVPPGVRVEMNGIGLMGGGDERTDDEGLPSTAPLVRVQWFALMGGVEVATKQLKTQKGKGRKDRELRDHRHHGELGH
jgi:hypothetical protein